MSEASIKLATAAGVSWLCATCKKYQVARDQGIDGHACMAAVVGSACGSPLGGEHFQEYDGPVTDLTRFCFVCGTRAYKGMRSKKSLRVFGVCPKHGPAWAALKKVEMAAQPPVPEITVGDGWIDLDKAPRKKALGELMIENGDMAPDGMLGDTK